MTELIRGNIIKGPNQYSMQETFFEVYDPKWVFTLVDGTEQEMSITLDVSEVKRYSFDSYQLKGVVELNGRRYDAEVEYNISSMSFGDHDDDDFRTHFFGSARLQESNW